MTTREFLTDLASKRSTELDDLAKRVEALEKVNEELMVAQMEIYI
jgi:hypothetical protein